MLGIIWTCGWFLTLSITSYIDAKTREITGEPPSSNETQGTVVVMCMAIWIVGLFLLA